LGHIGSRVVPSLGILEILQVVDHPTPTLVLASGTLGVTFVLDGKHSDLGDPTNPMQEWDCGGGLV
jgi:hypothetical protein